MNVHGGYSFDECPAESNYAGNPADYGGRCESASIGGAGKCAKRYQMCIRDSYVLSGASGICRQDALALRKDGNRENEDTFVCCTLL